MMMIISGLDKEISMIAEAAPSAATLTRQVSSSQCPICEGVASGSGREAYDDRFGYPGRFPVYQCEACNHQFLKADFDGEQIKALYTKYYPRAEVNVDTIGPIPALHGFKDWLQGCELSLHQVPRNVKVLDIGCGFGQTLLYHRERGCEAHGIEADEHAQKAAAKFGLDIKLGIFSAGLYPENYFDYVTMDQVIEHVPQPRETLAQISQVLKLGGRFVFSTPNGASLSAKLLGDKWLHWHAPYHVQFFSKASIRKLVDSSDFKIISIRQVTNAAWMYYQWLHIINYPGEGQPSRFWAADRVSAPAEYDHRKERLTRIANAINHRGANKFLTRLLDALGLGDNFLVTLEKVK
jgi:2-polyprenyl-3-methyl-5-hydroxy-6-metoxy-1,4-benzoquinol methylase